MPHTKRIPIPPGLPAHLCDGKQGYEALCALLKLTTRERKQAIANAPSIKRHLKATGDAPTRHARTSERTRQSLIALYSNPDTRREMWRHFLNNEQSSKADSMLVPSVEQAAFSQYDAELLSASSAPETLNDVNAFYDQEVANEEWRTVALVALRRLKEDFSDWASVPPDRRDKVISAAFATATLLDDSRLLLWASDRGEDIAHEYSFLSKAAYGGKDIPSHSGSGADKPPSRVDSGEDLPAQLRKRALALGEAARSLADGPATATMFKVLSEQFEEVIELQEPILAMAGEDAVNSLIDDFCVLLEEKAISVPWLAEERESVLAAWREAYLSAEEVQLEQVRADINRATVSLPPALAAVAAAQTNEYEAKKSLDLHETEVGAKATASRTDRQRRNKLSEAYTVAGKAVSDAMDAVVEGIKPLPDGVPIQPKSPEADSAVPTEHDTNPITANERSSRQENPHVKPLPDGPHPVAAGSAAPSIEPSQGKLEEDEEEKEEEPPSPDSSQGESFQAEEEPLVSEDKPPAVVAPSSDAAPQAKAESDPTSATIAADSSQTHTAIWHAIGTGRIGLAYHISRLEQAIGHTTQPSPELLSAVALGTVVSGPEDDLATAFGRRVGPLVGLGFKGVDPQVSEALNLLLFAATLRPAVFTSQHGASIQLLRRVELSGDLTAVYRLASAIADQADNLKTVHVDVPTLTAILDEGVWKDRIAAHREDVAHWRESAGAATFLFHAASVVWQHWLGRKGVLGELTRLLGGSNANDIQRVQEIAEHFDDKKAIHALIEETDHHAVGRHGEPITGRALSQLESRLDAPRDLARDWLRIMRAKPGRTEFLVNAVENLRSTVNECAPPAIQAIRHLRQTEPAAELDGALACAVKAIESLTRLFQHDGDIHAEIALEPKQALSDDLLFVTEMAIDGEGRIDDTLAPEDALALLVDTERHAKTFAEAFEARLSQDDLYGAHLVCNRMTAEDEDLADACRERLDLALKGSRSSHQHRLYDLAEKLEQAFVIGEILEAQREELTAAIDDASRCLESSTGALTVGSSIKVISDTVESACKRGVTKVSTELDAYLPRAKKREQALVSEAIQAGDLATLHEQLDCLKRGQPLLSTGAVTRTRLHSFLAAASHIEAELDGEAGPSQPSLVQAVSQRTDTLGLPFSSLSPAQAKRSTRLLDLWFEIARQRSPSPDLVAQFFGALGFRLSSGAVEQRGDAAAVLRTESLRARELCPTHAFGSDAEGRYDLIFNWSTLAREPIVQAIAAADPSSHMIVLHFGKLSGMDRDWLRRWSIEHPTQFITVDEILVLYLASLPEGQLRALFDCTLPFTCTEPYFTAPGLMPPEAFFGRERERRDIIDRYGTCFVYGGRQLGKTALLHSSEAAFHAPEAHRIAKYVDLKYEDIGIAHDADYIWQVLWREFIKLDIVDQGTTMPRGRDSLVNAIARSISDWLSTHNEGRILLLLDEADAFLAKDLEGDFRVSTRLKGLMDETERRFKVVLCGLHNVLRNTERANHPLAHFGEPVCVGPLLSNGDLEQARALVREPLAAVGYEFETDNLITKILIWTNYYPSLIQIYGQALLRHLRQMPSRDFPRLVTAEDIQAVFVRDQFRDYIRDRFSLTLQLDQRYEVIAYAMAFDLQGASDRLAEGLPSNRIFELTREYWPEGFDISKREFGTLLREMCGLGVLRKRPDTAGPGRYVFRNPNVFHLLGDADNILDVLYKKRKVPDVFEASAFHAQYDRTKVGRTRRGPITYEQETVLNRGGRVAVLCGNEAVNFADVGKFLSERVERGRLRTLEASMNANALAGVVKRLRPDRDTYICLVDEDEPWSLLWLERVADALHEAQRGRKLRVVFRADPEQLWRFVDELPDEYLEPDTGLFDWIGAQPWDAAFLRHWCSDLGLHEVGGGIADLLQLTGGWPLLLERYAAFDETTWGAKAAKLKQYIAQNRDELLAAIGLGEPGARHELAPLLAWEKLNPSEVNTYIDLWEEDGGEPVDPRTLSRRLHWASLLGIVQDVGGSTMLNPLVARLMSDDAV